MTCLHLQRGDLECVSLKLYKALLNILIRIISVEYASKYNAGYDVHYITYDSYMRNQMVISNNAPWC